MADYHTEQRPKRKCHDFIWALRRLRKGLPVSRWNGWWHWGKDTAESYEDAGDCVFVYRGHELRAYALRDNSNIDLMPFNVSNKDLVATDWCMPVRPTKSDLCADRQLTCSTRKHCA